MARAFVAIRPPAEVLDAVAARVASVDARGARATPRDQWHLTVRFLGDEVDLDAVAGALTAGPFGAVAGKLRVGGAMTFGAARRARLLALGLAAGAQWMRRLAAQVEAACASVGCASDRDHEFVPHLTLARFRTPTDLRPLCAALGPEPVGDPWVADELVLFESILGSEGPRHMARASIPLGL